MPSNHGWQILASSDLRSSDNLRTGNLAWMQSQEEGTLRQDDNLMRQERHTPVPRPLRILFVAPYAPSPIRRRTLNFLVALATAGHDVRAIISDVHPLPGERSLIADQLAGQGVEVRLQPHSFLRGLYSSFTAIGGPKPLRVAYSDSTKMREAVRRALEDANFDLIHVENIRALQYIPNYVGQPVILDAVDCMSLRWATLAREGNFRDRLMARYEHTRILRYEAAASGRVSRVLVTTHVDAEALKRHAPNADIVVVPHGIDIEHFGEVPSAPKSGSVIFTGAMNYHANRLAILRFVKTTWSLITAEQPAARLWIVGTAPGRSVRRLRSDPSITVTGYVEDVRPYLSSASVAICPISAGSGIQNKILEAMAAGVPVVCSRLAATPMVRFGFTDGVHFLQADGSAAEAAAVCRILSDAALARSIANTARIRLRETMSLAVVTRALESAYFDALQKRAPRSPEFGKGERQ